MGLDGGVVIILLDPEGRARMRVTRILALGDGAYAEGTRGDFTVKKLRAALRAFSRPSYCLFLLLFSAHFALFWNFWCLLYKFDMPDFPRFCNPGKLRDYLHPKPVLGPNLQMISAKTSCKS